MTFRLLNRVRMSVLGAPGTGAITLNAAAAGFQSFVSAGMAYGDTCGYVIDDGNPVGSAWEIGLGTLQSNGTLTRDTVTQSSLGGTTKISATSNAFVSAAFRAEDLAGGSMANLSDVNLTGLTDGDILVWDAGTSKWVRRPAGGKAYFTAPQLVQYGTVQTNPSSGDINCTLPGAPTAHNHLIAIGQGGGSTTLGNYVSGFNFELADVSFAPDLTNNQYAVAWGVRSVRSGDGATFKIGVGGNAGYEFNGVLAEVSGLDMTRLNRDMVTKSGAFGSVTTLIDALATDNVLSLLYVAAATGSLTITNPGTIQFNNDDGTSRLAFAYNTGAGDWNGISGSTALSNRVLVLNLPGYST